MAKPRKKSDGRFDLADQIKRSKVELKKTDQLIPYARNARKHEDWQVAQIAASIKEFGFTNPVLIDETGEIVAGHGRVMAALKLNLDEVPCIVLGHLTPTQRKAYVLADNQLALNSSWDMGLLGVELEELKLDGFDLDLLGFGEDALGFVASEIEMPDLKSGDKEPFQQMAFILHDDQAADVKRALEIAINMGEFVGENLNKNGNAIHRICDFFITSQRDD